MQQLAGMAGDAIGVDVAGGLKTAGKYAGKVGKALGYVDTAADVVGSFLRFGETMSGIGEPDCVRQARSMTALARSDRRSTAGDVDRVMDEQRSAEIQAGARWLPEAIQSKVVAFQKRQAGLDPLAMAQRAMIQKQINDRVLNVNSSNVLQKASNRIYQDKFGLVQGALRQGLDRQLAKVGIHNEELEARIAAKGLQMEGRAAALANAGFTAISEGHLGQGREFLKQANGEVPGAVKA
jgi:hypothetical protein